MGKRNTKKNGKQREKREKNKKIREREKFGFGGTHSMANAQTMVGYGMRIDGTQPTRENGSRYLGYDGYIVGGTWPTIIMRQSVLGLQWVVDGTKTINGSIVECQVLIL